MFLPRNLKCHLNRLYTFFFTDSVDRGQHIPSGGQQVHVKTSEVGICNTFLVVRLYGLV